MSAFRGGGSATETTFVGRQEELAALRGQLDRARSGVSSVVLLEGPAGHGKTALLDRFVTLAGPEAVLRSSGDEDESLIAYGLYRQLTGGLAQLSGARSVSDEGSTGSSRPADLQAAGEFILEQVSSVADQHKCLVVTIDDAHFADRQSLAAMSYGVRRLQSAECAGSSNSFVARTRQQRQRTSGCGCARTSPTTPGGSPLSNY